MDLIVRKGNEIIVLSDTLYMYPEFEAILKEYGKHSDGLLSVIKYIYFSCDRKSYAIKNGYSQKEIHAYALQQAGLSEKFEVTNSIKAAQECYKTNDNKPMEDYINNFVKALRIGNKICDAILEKQDVAKDMSDEQLTSITNAIDKVLSLSSNINKSIPALISNIKDLRSLEEEDAKNTSEKVRGGKEIPESYEQTDEE